MAPNLLTLLWQHWEATWSLDVEAALAVTLYLIAVRRNRSPWPLRRTASFVAGVAAVLVALQSGYDAFDDRLLSAHMIQHLILLELAPLLVLASRPGLLALRAAPTRTRPVLARRLHDLRPITQPLSCLAIFFVVVFATHIPAFYNATLRSAPLHDLEHVLYLTAGLFMWWPVLDADPLPRRRLDGFGRLVYVIAAMLPMTLIGAFLARQPTLVYAGYGRAAHALGISAVLDQQRAGAIMWVLGSTLMVAAGLWQAMAAMVREERRLQVRERRLEDLVIFEPGSET